MCVHCNSEYVSPGEGTMMCHSCEIRYGKSDSDDIVYCENCGCRLWYEDAIIVGDNGDYLCDECASRITKTCRDCGNPYYIDDLTYHKDDEDENGGYYLCGWCEQDRQETTENVEDGSCTISFDDFDLQSLTADLANPQYYIHNENGEWVPLGRIPEINTSTSVYETEARNILIQE